METPATGFYFEGEYGAILPSLQGLSLSCREEAARATSGAPHSYPYSLPNHSQRHSQSHGSPRSRAAPPPAIRSAVEQARHLHNVAQHPFRIANSVFGASPRDQHLQAPEGPLAEEDHRCLMFPHQHQQAADDRLRKPSFAQSSGADAMGPEVRLMQGLAISQHSPGAGRESHESVAGDASIFTSDLRDALPPDGCYTADMGWGSSAPHASHASRASSCGQSLVWGDVVVACSGDGDYADSELSFLMQQSNISDASEMSYASYIS